MLQKSESDARHGGFDFREAHEAAPADLQELLDRHESLVGCAASATSCLPPVCSP